MDRQQFILEEYRALKSAIQHHQEAYLALENYTFGGVLVVYGVLLGIPVKEGISHAPSAVWWGVFVLICIACIRCAGHYVIVRKLAGYVSQIEDVFYARYKKLIGFEHYHRNTGLGPWSNLAASFFAWFILVAGALVLAIARTFGFF